MEPDAPKALAKKTRGRKPLTKGPRAQIKGFSAPQTVQSCDLTPYLDLP